MILLFRDCELDVERRQLQRAGEDIHLEPQVFDLLTYLVAHRDRVISKDEIIEKVWRRRIVSDATLSTRINAVRSALGDDGKSQRFLQTLPRRGFRFVAEVHEQTSSAL